ncbi:Lipase 2 precursor [compost metagenome]
MKRFTIIALLTLGLSVLFSTTTFAANGSYAALGDSVAAGAGLTTIDPTCGRSIEAYPHTVATSTGLSLSHYACTGAKTDEGIYDSQERHASILPAQLDQAYSAGTPSLITLTIGANDTRWTQFIRQCYYIRCGYAVDTTRFNAYLVDLKLELNIAMAKIHTLSSGTPPQVIVTGYYSPFSSATCNETSGITANEASWLTARSNSLNSAISGTVAKYSYGEFASVSFAGHELCSSDSWIQGPSSSMPFHPTAAGQQAIAASVLSHYEDAPAPSNESLSYRERALNWYERLFR